MADDIVAVIGIGHTSFIALRNGHKVELDTGAPGYRPHEVIQRLLSETNYSHKLAIFGRNLECAFRADLFIAAFPSSNPHRGAGLAFRGDFGPIVVDTIIEMDVVAQALMNIGEYDA